MKTLWHKRWYQYRQQWCMYVCYGEVWSLKCTSLVAGNTQWLVSMGKQRKGVIKAMMAINVMARVICPISRWGYRSCFPYGVKMVARIPSRSRGGRCWWPVLMTRPWRKWAAGMSMSNRTLIAETQKHMVPQLKFSKPKATKIVGVGSGKWWCGLG